MKRKKIAEGKKGKAESRRRKRRSQKRQKRSKQDIETLGGDGVENSQLMLLSISYCVKSFYGISVLKIDARIRTGFA